MKKQRTIWLSEIEFKQLKEKASEYFEGKGFLEKYIRKIINEKLIFIQGSGNIKIVSE